MATGFLLVATLASWQHGRALFDTEPRIGTPVLDSMPTPAGPGSAEPSLDVDPDGRVHLSWLEPAGDGYALKVARLEKNAWSRPTTIRAGRDFFVNWADFPSVLSLGDNRLVAHWLQRTGSATYAYAVRMSSSRDGGATWSQPFQPHTDSSNTEHGFVSLWRSRRGDAVEAVWLDGRKYNKSGHHPANEMSLATASFRLDGRVVFPEQIVDGRVCDCCQTSAAPTREGVVVVYRDRSADEIRDIAVVRRRETTGSPHRWTEPKPVHPDGWKIAACPVNGPSVAARGDTVVVAWFTAANDTPMVKLAFSTDAGATFAAPIRIDEGRPAGRVDVELTRRGAALVSWIERMGGETAAVRVRRVDGGGRVDAPMTIASSSAARASGFPRMAIAGDHAIFAWTEPARVSLVRIARMKIQ